MSARRTLRKTRKSSIKNSPLVLSHGSNKKSMSSEAFVFESEPINSSFSSVFTDNEQIEVKNKKTGRKKKIRQTEDLTHLLDAGSTDSAASSVFTDNEEIEKKKTRRRKKIMQTEDLTYFMEPGSTDSVSDSDPNVKKDEAGTTKTSGVSLASATKSTRKRKKPIFTLPDITNPFKSDNNDLTQNTTVKKVGGKKKIRYTEDLNATANVRKDLDVTSKTKSKKTKRARLPSFLPSVDMIVQDKKVNRSKSAENTDSDNKENDTNTETTDPEECVKKTRRGRSRKNKKKVSKNELEKVSLDNGEAIDIRSANKTKESTSEVADDTDCLQKKDQFNGTMQRNSRLRQSKQTKDEFNLSAQNSNIEITSPQDKLTTKDRTKIDYSVIIVNEDTQNDLSSKNKSIGKRKSLRNTSHSTKSQSEQDKEDEHSKMIDQNDIEYTSPYKHRSRKNTFDLSDMESSSCPDKKRRKNNGDNELTNVISVMSLEQDDDNNTVNSFKKSAKRSTFEIPSKNQESLINIEECQTRTRPSIPVESSNISKSGINDQNDIDLSTNKRKSKRNTFDYSNVESFSCPDNNSHTKNVENYLMNASSVISQEQAEDLHTINSFKKSAKRSTFEIPSYNQESFTKIEGRQTRNRPSRPVESTEQNSTKEPRKSSFKVNNQSVVILDSSNIPNTGSSRKSARSSRTVLRSSTFDVDDSKGKTPKLRREGTFEISSTNPEQSFQQEASEISGLQELSATGTFDTAPSCNYSRTRNLIVSSSDEGDVTIVDLTESVSDNKVPSSSKRLKGNTLNKESLESRSSFEFSFKVKRDKKSSDAILDHLNVTRRDSRKSSFKKSSTGLKLSTGSEDEDVKKSSSFVTLKRGCHTMIDFDTGNSSDDLNSLRSGRGDLKKFRNFENLASNSLGDNKGLLNDKSLVEASETTRVKKPVPKKSILKRADAMDRTRTNRRDTYEIAECFYETLEKNSKAKLSVSVVKEADSNITMKTPKGPRDIFDVVSKTPTIELGKYMLGSGESVIASSSFLQDTVNRSTMPRLTRTSTYTKNEEETIPTPPRKSLRKRWSQVERTPIFGKLPNGDSSIISDQTANASINKSKSVQFISPPDLTSKKQLQSTLKTTVRKTRTAEKAKKSVKIESPLKTPTIRLHSPLVMKKTPGPNFSAAETSIISGNCAFKSVPKLSPPSSTSTPFQKKKGISLLQKVLTSGKNKSNNVSGKSCPRTKMPDFSKIHQRQFEKMENLKEMQERKAARAQFLLSGSKPPPSTSAPGITEKESRKQLMFSPLKKEPPKSNVSNPKNKRTSKGASKPFSKPLQHMLKKRASLEKKKKEMKSKVPIPAPKPTIPTQRVEAKAFKKTEPKGFTRFGFKVAPGKENVTKEEQIKAITTKSKLPVDRTEKNRNQLGGVRSNRRFELLMKMRQNKKVS